MIGSKLALSLVLSCSAVAFAGGAGLENPNTFTSQLSCKPTAADESSIEWFRFQTFSNGPLTRQEISFAATYQGVRELVRIYKADNSRFFEIHPSFGLFKVASADVKATVRVKKTQDTTRQGVLGLDFAVEGQEILLTGSIAGILEGNTSLVCESH